MKTIILKTFLLASLITCYADCSASTLHRSSSVANLYERAREAPVIESPEKYIELAEKFFKVNGPGSAYISAMRNELCSKIALLYHLANVFGVKKYKNIHNDFQSSSSSSSSSSPSSSDSVGDPLEVLTIDISWPNLKRVILDFLKANEITCVQPAEDKEEALTPNNLRWILEESPLAKIGEKEYFSEKPLEEGENASRLSEEDITLLMRLCFGSPEKRALSLYPYGGSEAKEKEIIRVLRGMLGNVTGAQRIMSILAVNTLNSLWNTPFVYDLQNIFIQLSDHSAFSSDYDPLLKSEHMIISLENSPRAVPALIHEMTHGYHYMITGKKNMQVQDYWLCNFCIMNSHIDFIDEFFPMLRSTNMNSEKQDSIVFKIKNLLKCTMFQDSEDGTETYNSKCNIDFAKNIITYLIKHGFGSIIFNNIKNTAIDENFRIDKFLTSEILAKSLYVYSWVFSDDFKKSDLVWSTNEEQNTILGKIVQQIGDKCFMLEDRQNEQISKVRVRMAAAEMIGYGEEHNFHNSAIVPSFTTIINENLSKILKGDEGREDYKKEVEAIAANIKQKIESPTTSADSLTTPSKRKFMPDNTETQDYRDSKDEALTEITKGHLLNNLKANSQEMETITPFCYTTDAQTIESLFMQLSSPATIISVLCQLIRANNPEVVRNCLPHVPDEDIDSKNVGKILMDLSYCRDNQDALIEVTFSDERLQKLINDKGNEKLLRRARELVSPGNEGKYPFLGNWELKKEVAKSSGGSGGWWISSEDDDDE